MTHRIIRNVGDEPNSIMMTLRWGILTPARGNSSPPMFPKFPARYLWATPQSAISETLRIGLTAKNHLVTFVTAPVVSARRTLAIITTFWEKGMGSLVFALGGSRSPRAGEFGKGGASHLIRSAEKLAASGKFDFAVEQLNVAQQLDPENRYIQAIIDRIRVMQNMPRDASTALTAPAERPQQLEVTVGPQFQSGIKSLEDEQTLTPEDVHKKVRFLTNMANRFLENGSSEKAFDSLMEAFLLDPSSPYVIAAEKTVLPAWEQSRTTGSNTRFGQVDFSHFGTNSVSNTGVQTMAPSFNDLNSPLSPRPIPSASEDQIRMDALLQQKEKERVEKERAVWRDASKPPKVFGEDDPIDSASTSQQLEQEQPKPHSPGLFSRLRLGKFLE